MRKGPPNSRTQAATGKKVGPALRNKQTRAHGIQPVLFRPPTLPAYLRCLSPVLWSRHFF